jgi:hypothetical protein
MKQLSKKMSLQEYASKLAIDAKEEQWILENEKDVEKYHNNGKSNFTVLSYPIYDGDYYFAFIGDSMRVNAKYNAQANRELRRLSKSTLSNDELFDKMENYFEMQFKNVGSGDTMTREELWFAILDIRDARVCDVCGSAS